MQKSREMIDLFRAIGAHDMQRAIDISRELATKEGVRGHYKVQRDLLGALNGAVQSFEKNKKSIQTAWRIEETLLPLSPSKALMNLELPAPLRANIMEIIAEWHARFKLKEHNLPRRWKLLFHGPPGSGKTATAAAIAQSIELPGYLVRFDSLIGAYLGQTALRLRELFNFAKNNACVILFDEVDAVAKRRGNPMDVGELDRIVIAFMQELEHSSGEGFIIATSNLPKALDDALWRRFDYHVSFPKAKPDVLCRFARKRCLDFGFKATPALLNKCSRAVSIADAEQIVMGEARKRIMAE